MLNVFRKIFSTFIKVTIQKLNKWINHLILMVSDRNFSQLSPEPVVHMNEIWAQTVLWVLWPDGNCTLFSTSFCETRWMRLVLRVKVVCWGFTFNISLAFSFSCCLQCSCSQCSGAGGGWGVPGWEERTVRESAGQKVQWSERLREEARPGGGAGQSRGSKASCLIALSDSTPALDGFFSPCL